MLKRQEKFRYCNVAIFHMLIDFGLIHEEGNKSSRYTYSKFLCYVK